MRAVLGFVIFGACVASTSASLPTPFINGGVLTYINNTDQPTIEVTCQVHSGWGDAAFVQIYIDEIVFLGSFTPFASAHTLNGEGEGGLAYIVTTNEVINSVYSHTRYSAVKTDTTLTLTIQDPQPEDTGFYACRTTYEDSNSTTIENRVSSNTVNVTVIGHVLGMEFFTADNVANWRYRPHMQLFAEGDTVNIATNVPKYFGCMVHYYTGVASVTGFWENGDERIQVDMGVWQQEHGGSFNVWGLKDGIPLHNQTMYFFAPTSEIPDLDLRDGGRFVCVNNPPMEDGPYDEASVLVRTFVGCEATVPTIVGDVLSYHDNQDMTSIEVTCYAPQQGWGTALYVQIYKSSIVFLGTSNKETIEGEENGELKYMMATNDIVSSGLDSDRYTAVKTDLEVKFVIQAPVQDDSGMYSCRTTMDNSSSTQIAYNESCNPANVTILGPLHGMEFFSAKVDGAWKDNLAILYSGSEVLLNSSEPMRFGCIIYYYTGLPIIKGFWQTGDTREPVDMEAWNLQDGNGEVVTTGGIPVNNASLLFFVITEDIPDITDRNNSQFVCQASTPLPDVLVQEIAMTVQCSTSTTLYLNGLVMILCALVAMVTSVIPVKL